MAWDSVHLFTCQTKLFYGFGSSSQVGDHLKALDVTKVLLVSDPGVKAAGIVDRVLVNLRDAGLAAAVYAETEANPTVQDVHAAAQLYSDEACDGLVGLGGGSSMDGAKGAGVIATNGGEITAYAGRDQVPNAIPPLVCIPTTCGTGSEVTGVAVISDNERHFKAVLASPRLWADVALVDPELVASAPTSVVAATGADALCHAVESYVNTGSDPLLDSINIAAIRMIGESLRPAVQDQDRDALGKMSLASTMAGVAFNMNANAIVHAASTPVTAHHEVPHGVANAIFLPAGLDFLRPACEEKLAEVAEALGADLVGLSTAEAAERAVEAIRELLSEIGLPASLREFGIDPAELDIPTLVQDAMKSRNIATNPRSVTEDDLVNLYKVVAG